MAAAAANTGEQSHRRRSVSKVGIIGAGISGIAAAKHLSSHHPVVFEATDSIGGVWKHCAYRTTRLQTPRRDFEFSDYPWPLQTRGNDDFPTHLEVLDYLHGYATHFDVLKFVKFNCKVVQLRYIGGPEAEDSTEAGVYGSLLNGRPVWEVAVEDTQLNTTQVIPLFILFGYEMIKYQHEITHILCFFTNFYLNQYIYLINPRIHYYFVCI